MDIVNVFKSDAFSMQALAAFIDKQPFVPTFLDSLGIFEPVPIRTTAIAIEERSGTLTLIPNSPRGAPSPAQRVRDTRKLRYFNTTRLYAGDTIQASELQDIREFVGLNGVTQTVMKQLMTEVGQRFAGPSGLRAQMDLTKEFHRLGAIRGIVYDANGTDVIYNWFEEFGISVPSTVYFDFATNTQYTLQAKVNGILRTMAAAASGSFNPSTYVVALCGNSFFDGLVSHKDCQESYLRQINAAVSRAGTTPVDGGIMIGMNAAYRAFEWGGVVWVNYRGTDDGTTVTVTADKAHFFPVNAPGIFKVAWGPGESMADVNMPGQPLYPKVIPDEKRQEFVELDLRSYPLYVCTKPGVLITGDKDAS